MSKTDYFQLTFGSIIPGSLNPEADDDGQVGLVDDPPTLRPAEHLPAIQPGLNIREEGDGRLRHQIVWLDQRKDWAAINIPGVQIPH